jgi:hypothetical protein
MSPYVDIYSPNIAIPISVTLTFRHIVHLQPLHVVRDFQTFKNEREVGLATWWRRIQQNDVTVGFSDPRFCMYLYRRSVEKFRPYLTVKKLIECIVLNLAFGYKNLRF